MSIILSLVGDGFSDDLLAPVGYRQVARISGKDVVRILGTRSCGIYGLPWPSSSFATLPGSAAFDGSCVTRLWATQVASRRLGE
jgi:hypothetical protein